MELDENQLKYIKALMDSQGLPLDAALAEEFPEAGITIIKHSFFSCILGAYFSQRDAKKVLSGIPDNLYPEAEDILIVTARNLHEGFVCLDRKKEELIDGMSKDVVYHFLESRLEEACRPAYLKMLPRQDY